MASLEELTLTAQPPEADDFSDDPEALMRETILDSLGLLHKCACLLDYLSDVDLCKTVTKRERRIMSNFSEQVKAFLAEAEDFEEEV